MRLNKSPRVPTPAFKAQVALAALKGDRTLSEIAAQYQIHVKLVQVWKKQMFEQAATVFNGRVQPVSQKDTAAQQAELFEPIGRLKMELEGIVDPENWTTSRTPLWGVATVVRKGDANE